MHENLTSDRLTLRPLKDTDAPAFAAMMGDRDISRMTATFSYPLVLPDAEIRIFMMQNKARRGLCFPYAIDDTLSGAFVGVINIFTNRDKDWEIGYWLGRPYWGRGYATEAGLRILAETDRCLGDDIIMAGVYADNPASLTVLKKLGFVETGERDMLYSVARRGKADGLRLQRAPKPVKTALN